MDRLLGLLLALVPLSQVHPQSTEEQERGRCRETPSVEGVRTRNPTRVLVVPQGDDRRTVSRLNVRPPGPEVVDDKLEHAVAVWCAERRRVGSAVRRERDGGESRADVRVKHGELELDVGGVEGPPHRRAVRRGLVLLERDLVRLGVSIGKGQAVW